MPSINKVSWLVTMPVSLCAILLGLPMLAQAQVAWWVPLVFWLFYGMVITGVISHRYFGHNSFTVPKTMRQILGFLVPLGAFGSPLSWSTLHRHHHVCADKPGDPHSPATGFWHAFLLWHMLDSHAINNYKNTPGLKMLLRDPAIVWPSKYFYHIFYTHLLLLLWWDYQLFFAGYCVAILIEYLRIGCIDTICHMPNFPGNYRNFATADHSQNNLILGVLGCGFGWHNNHHQQSNKMILSRHWWEIDIEGYCCKLLQGLGRIFTRK